MDALQAALNDADFQWTTHIDSIWRDPSADIRALQQTAREHLGQRLSGLQRASDATSPLGVALLGTGGSGKTHVLSSVRRQAFEHGQYFVLVDMTDVREFWETVLLGYLRSLDQQNDGEPQFSRLLKRLIEQLGPEAPTFKQISTARPPALINRCNGLIRALSQKYRTEAREHQDVLRALALISSDDFDIQENGYQWLQGVGIQEKDGFVHDFMTTQKKPDQIVRGLSWLMSLDAPTVLALDQLDAIVAEHNLASATSSDTEPSPRQLASLSIIQSIAGGLSALRDVTRRTLTVVSSLESTWHILDARVPVTMKDRFEPPLLLQPIRDAASIRQLVEMRLAQSYASHDVKPRYASYPFAPGFFTKRIGLLPREVLKACNEHRHACATAGKVLELDGEEPTVLPTPATLDHELRSELVRLVAAATVTDLIENEDEDALDKLIEVACDALVEENELPEDFDALIDKDFIGSGSFEPLHARLRVVDRGCNERERHYAYRFLEKTQHIAFQSRLKAAITAAGIAEDLEFRRLALIRMRPLPSSPLSTKLLAELRQRGGLVLVPTEHELKVLAALKELLHGDGQRAARTRQWLRSERVVSRLPLFADTLTFLFRDPAANRPPDAPVTMRPPALASTSIASSATPGPSTPASSAFVAPATRAWASELVFGEKLLAGAAAGNFSVPLDNLTKHTVVLAGAGSGKTVLVRRIIEEAALAGIPSIVLDGANDLSRLGDAWPSAPESFTEEDRTKAAQYHAQAEVVIWTPGRERGNPIRLQPLPDFAGVLNDPDELNSALDMARSSLEPIAIGAKIDKVRQGVLSSALRFFAKQGGGGLDRLIAILSELPGEANAGYEKGEKLAREAADRLLAETETNPLFRGDAQSLDPAMLLRARAAGKVRVSVINLSGLPDQGAQQQFVNQLAMTLFSWIKKNPARGRALQGLLVIDEARDFVPSGKSVPGKDNLIRLVAQARKYGLGIVFATQAPKSIDHNIIANCSTQFYGRQNSPAAIDTVKDQLTQRGTSGSDVAKLPRGVFYAFTEGLPSAIKIQTPLCLSHHPSSPPDEDEVMIRAERSKALL
jgi:hypothetical protein